MFDKTQHSYS